MDIYLIRHTSTAAEKGLCYGQSNINLADSFSDDFQQLIQKLPAFQNAYRVFSSPLSRCLKLANYLSNNVTIDLRLLEINFGDWENQYFDSLDTEQLQNWADNFVNSAPPNGESFSELVTRVSDFWQDLINCEVPQVFIISHAGVIRALLAHVLQLPLKNAFQFQVNYGSVHKLQYMNQYTYINYLNL